MRFQVCIQAAAFKYLLRHTITFPQMNSPDETSSYVVDVDLRVVLRRTEILFPKPRQRKNVNREILQLCEHTEARVGVLVQASAKFVAPFGKQGQYTSHVYHYLHYV